jgi:hypothetical protein
VRVEAGGSAGEAARGGQGETAGAAPAVLWHRLSKQLPRGCVGCGAR